MSIVTSTRLVAGRELRETFRRKSFWAVALVLLVGSSAAMIVPELLSDDSDPTVDIAVIGGGEELRALLAAAAERAGWELELRTVDDAQELRSLVEDDEVDLGVDANEPPTVVVRSGAGASMTATVRAAVQQQRLVGQLRDDGLSTAEIDAALAVPAPRLEELDAESEGRQAVSFAISFVLYLLLLTLMVQVANGVAIEKANRVSEVLLAIVRPGALLFGKVIGVGVGGFTMLVAGAIPVVVKLVAGGDLPAGVGGAVAGTVVWFALGLMLYLTMSGALGALVERQEQAGAVTAPLTFVLIGTFIAAQSSADTALGTVLAYFPLTSPLMMPSRIAIGATSTVELVVSLLLLVAAIALAARIGSTIYARSIVRTGTRLTVREALRQS